MNMVIQFDFYFAGVADETPSNTKRKKQDNTCLLNRISKNSPDINVLEIWHCLR